MIGLDCLQHTLPCSPGRPCTLPLPPLHALVYVLLQDTGLLAKLVATKQVFMEPRQAGDAFDASIRCYYACVDGGQGAIFMAVCRGKVSRAWLVGMLCTLVTERQAAGIRHASACHSASSRVADGCMQRLHILAAAGCMSVCSSHACTTKIPTLFHLLATNMPHTAPNTKHTYASHQYRPHCSPAGV